MPAPVVHASERPTIVFLAAFVALAVVTTAAWQWVPALRSRVDIVGHALTPDRGEFYLANGRGGPVDHHVLYFSLDDGAVAHLRAADVLFLGNSRLLFAMDPEIFRPAFAARGLKPYVMGFGYREGDAFPLDLIRRLDLHPKLVVVNADGFFGQGLSDWAKEVVDDSHFDAWKWRYESDAAHAVGKIVHTVLPNWVELYGRPGFPIRAGFIAHRSRVDGSWLVSPSSEAPVLIPENFPGVPEPGAHEIAGILGFKREVEARGGRLVLTTVPSPARYGGSPVRLAQEAGVPFVYPAVPGLATIDGSHLDPESARHWTRAFVDDLGPYLP